MFFSESLCKIFLKINLWTGLNKHDLNNFLSSNNMMERLLKSHGNSLICHTRGTLMHTDVHEMTYSWNTNKKVVQNAPFDSSNPLNCIIVFPYVKKGRFEAYFPWSILFDFWGKERLSQNKQLDVRKLEDFTSSAWSKRISSILQVCHMLSISWFILHVFVFYSCRAASCWKRSLLRLRSYAWV